MTEKPKSAAVRPAATAILLRETTGPHPFEVLLLKRSKDIAFAGGLWVFPGGSFDGADYAAGQGFDDCDDKQLLALATRAAVRETQEESGVDITEQSFVFYSHWTTPEQYKKRFATWFVMAQVPSQQTVTVDDYEITHHQWCAPVALLEQLAVGEIDMMPPTYICLHELSLCGSIDEAMGFARGREVPYFAPVFRKRGEQLVFLYEGDAGYVTGDADASGRLHRLERDGYNYTYLNVR